MVEFFFHSYELTIIQHTKSKPCLLFFVNMYENCFIKPNQEFQAKINLYSEKVPTFKPNISLEKYYLKYTQYTKQTNTDITKHGCSVCQKLNTEGLMQNG